MRSPSENRHGDHMKHRRFLPLSKEELLQLTEKRCEAIPKLLDIIDVAGKIVTIDAKGTQKDISEKIIDKKADYVLALKANHEVPYNGVVKFFSQVSDEKYQDEIN